MMRLGARKNRDIDKLMKFVLSSGDMPVTLRLIRLLATKV